jgi:hypothetical protein
MRTFRTLLLATLAALAASQLPAQSMRADSGRDWLMLVATNSTDPGKEAEFNAWYDDVDIPDVLEVPGYVRARRGRKEELGAAGGVKPSCGAGGGGVAGKYVALYDIESPNMDRTIIDMLMATIKMESRKRSTPLLEVVERLYYRRMAQPAENPDAKATGRNDYILIDRLDGARAPVPMRAPCIVRSTRYELYRVLMADPIEVPRFLTIHELRADSAEQALMQLPASEGRNARTLYVQIKDVRRPASSPPTQCHSPRITPYRTNCAM